MTDPDGMRKIPLAICLGVVGFAPLSHAVCKGGKLEKQAFLSALEIHVASLERALSKLESGLRTTGRGSQGAFSTAYALSDRPSWDLQWEMSRVLDKNAKYEDQAAGVSQWLSRFNRGATRQVTCRTAAEFLKSSVGGLKDIESQFKLIQAGWVQLNDGVDESGIQLVSRRKSRKKRRKRRSRRDKDDWNPEELIVYMQLIFNESAMDGLVSQFLKEVGNFINNINSLTSRLRR